MQAQAAVEPDEQQHSAPVGGADGLGRWRGGVFVATILLGSFLLFLVQPMIARMALSKLGGAPAVWNSAMLIYQALLLAGYAYAHVIGRVPVRRQAVIHLVVLAVAALWLPIGLIAIDLPPDARPEFWVPWLLAASIGPLFFAISAQAPLIQRWFSAASGGRDPYALYAASNIGSFGGLIAYPLVVEPWLPLNAQSMVWTLGYGLVIIAILGCALLLPRGAGRAADRVATVSAPPTPHRVALWIVLGLVPSGLMLATTSLLTTDVVAVPMLWVLPLGLYLLSFSIAFASNRWMADGLTRIAPVVLILFGGLMITGSTANPGLYALMALMLLFMVAVALHTRMYDLRPAADRLTGFYLAMSLGGVLGGILAGLIAPILFDWTYEYPLLILAAGLLIPAQFLLPVFRRLWGADRVDGGARTRLAGTLIVAVIVVGMTAYMFVQGANPGQMRSFGLVYLGIAMMGVASIGVRAPFMIVLASALFLFGGSRALLASWDGDARTRSYFGVYTINESAQQISLAHGTTLHGLQLKGSMARLRTSTTYYATGSGVGQVMEALPDLYGPRARVGVVGLGAGTLACYARAGQQWRFYEIDPTVVPIARTRFRFLDQCNPGAAMVIGDARLRLAQAPRHSLDLLVLDAFSSDAVPMHLMTREAFDTYGHVLDRDGLLLVHVSNRYMSLEPVVAAIAAHGGWAGAQFTYLPDLDAEADGATASNWIALSKSPARLTQFIQRGGGWMPLRAHRDVAPWTDDFASILPVLRGLNGDLP